MRRPDVPGVRPHLPLRDAEGADRFQAFLVSAVASIAVTRTFLVLTGYPQLGGGCQVCIAWPLGGGMQAGQRRAHALLHHGIQQRVFAFEVVEG